MPSTLPGAVQPDSEGQQPDQLDDIEPDNIGAVEFQEIKADHSKKTDSTFKFVLWSRSDKYLKQLEELFENIHIHETIIRKSKEPIYLHWELTPPQLVNTEKALRLIEPAAIDAVIIAPDISEEEVFCFLEENRRKKLRFILPKILDNIRDTPVTIIGTLTEDAYDLPGLLKILYKLYGQRYDIQTTEGERHEPSKNRLRADLYLSAPATTVSDSDSPQISPAQLSRPGPAALVGKSLPMLGGAAAAAAAQANQVNQGGQVNNRAGAQAGTDDSCCNIGKILAKLCNR